MAFETWDDAMFWHGSLIGYMAGVKSMCKDEDKSSLLLRMADTQKELEAEHALVVTLEQSDERLRAENAKLRTLIDLKETCWKYVGWCDECPYNGMDDEHDECNCTVREKISLLAHELGVSEL